MNIDGYNTIFRVIMFRISMQKRFNYTEEITDVFFVCDYLTAYTVMQRQPSRWWLRMWTEATDLKELHKLEIQ
jgi:hypothetical protein